jgi:hypothetical protein
LAGARVSVDAVRRKNERERERERGEGSEVSRVSVVAEGFL